MYAVIFKAKSCAGRNRGFYDRINEEILMVL